jgi:transposase
MRPTGTAVELERRRLHAVGLVSRGEPRATVARILGVHIKTLARWCRADRAGPNGLAARPTVGPAPRLTDVQIQELGVLLAEGAVAHGWENNLWTTARVAQVIEKRFMVKYHAAHVSKILRKRLNWTCQKPEQHYKDRDDKAIARWVAEDFPIIAADAAIRGAWIVFIDETGFMLVPTVRRTYAPRGQTPVHRIGDPHGRISAAGAIAISPRRDGIRLRYELLADQVNFRGPSITQFLRDLRSDLGGPMTVLWDQIPIHECAQVSAFLAAHPDVVAESFPPYAPELNPADGIWRYVKYGRLPNYTPYEMGQLRGRVTEELDRLKESPELLKSFVRFSKLPIEL